MQFVFRRRMSCACAAFIIIILTGLACAPAQAQSPNRTTVAIAMGAIRNLQNDRGLPTYAAYPEVEAFTELHSSAAAGVTFGAGFYVGGWTDGIGRAARCPHCVTYSHTSSIVGFRGAARLDHFLLPLTFWGGVSRHEFWADYVGGSSGYGPTRGNHRVSSNALESGVRLEIPLLRRLTLEPRAHTLWPIPFSADNPFLVRFAWMMGVRLVL